MSCPDLHGTLFCLVRKEFDPSVNSKCTTGPGARRKKVHFHVAWFPSRFLQKETVRKVTALIVYKRKVAGATKKVAVATFARAKEKNNPKLEFWIDRKKVAAATFFPRAKVATATFVGATQTCSHFGLPTWAIGGTWVFLYTKTGHFRSQLKECLRLMSTMLVTLKKKPWLEKSPLH